MLDKTKIKTPGTVNSNLFPVHVLPSTFRNLVKGLNETLKFPVDYTGTAILTAVSATIGTTVKVKVKDGWHEYGSLYTCLIGDAGANKSHPLETVFNPIKKLDKRWHDTYISEYEKYKEYLKLNRRQSELAKPIPEPVLKKIALTNFTPEILNKRLNDNPRGCVVLSDEISSFIEGMNNYSKKDNSATYLSFWSNKATTIDRVSKPVPLFMEIPFLCIIGGLQPRLISKVFPAEKLNSGFFQRFLFAFPQGLKKEPINDNVLENNVFEQYSDFITNYIKRTSKDDAQTQVLNWTKEAKDYFYRWQTKNCDLVNANPDSIKGEVISKYDSHFIRFSLILQMMEDPESSEISIKAVKGANALCKYYMNCTFKVLAKIQSPKSRLNLLPDNKKQFYKMLKSSFTTAQAIELGVKFDISQRRVNGFLKDHHLFKNIKHGHYEKTVKS